MPLFEGKFFNIVFIGRLNPQILNHDFLLNNRVLPEDKEPFKTLVLVLTLPMVEYEQVLLKGNSTILFPRFFSSHIPFKI